ncbi:hypothetical protein BV25DRAFT_1239434 [Artomyces pyxidatus]|uniref:Uncharacterized protein n=1 Tax=Artomyces pyxidatus TaxID=48021 RepID=A0ACB8SRE1_9AGAM|nr:hypothetical protein BV25DRAFT_1239434 [Artomyces pyxidatus]
MPVCAGIPCDASACPSVPPPSPCQAIDLGKHPALRVILNVYPRSVRVQRGARPQGTKCQDNGVSLLDSRPSTLVAIELALFRDWCKMLEGRVLSNSGCGLKVETDFGSSTRLRAVPSFERKWSCHPRHDSVSFAKGLASTEYPRSRGCAKDWTCG